MANQSRSSNRSTRVIRNINSAVNHRAVRTTGKYAVKGIEKTARWMATDHTNATERMSIIGLQQSSNYLLASMVLGNRRVERLLGSGQRFRNIFEVATGWLIDHALYIWDLLWGFIWPIVFYLLIGILAIVLIVVFNFIFFYALFWFCFRNSQPETPPSPDLPA